MIRRGTGVALLAAGIASALLAVWRALLVLQCTDGAGRAVAPGDIALFTRCPSPMPWVAIGLIGLSLIVLGAWFAVGSSANATQKG